MTYRQDDTGKHDAAEERDLDRHGGCCVWAGRVGTANDRSGIGFGDRLLTKQCCQEEETGA